MPKWAFALIVAVLVLCCCVSLVAIVAGGLAIFPLSSSPKITPFVDFPTPVVQETQVIENPDATPEPTQPVATMVVAPPDDGADQTLKLMESIVVPDADPVELAERLQGKVNIQPTVDSPKPTKIGEKRKFWVSNVDTNENFQVDATLRYVGDHLYFWIQDGLDYRKQALTDLAQAFDKKMYEKDREFFGSEWNPGVDNDPKVYILYAKGLGSNIAAYFSSADEIPPDAHKYSNAHEMFIVNYDTTKIEDDYVYGTLAHEFQHMIHWYGDRNEEGWMNEGFSELASFLNGYDPGGFDALFTQDPDLQLNTWPNDPGNPNATPPHYGAGFLFTDYLLDRFGEDATKAVVADKENGLVSIDDVLKKLNITDKLTGAIETADTVFRDWSIANYLNDPNVADGRYAYHAYKDLLNAVDTESVDNCPAEAQDRTVHQYGTDYIKLNCRGKFTINFQGSREVGLIPEGAHSGSYAFWSNQGDTSDMKLDHVFDFSNTTGPIDMKYWTWFDIEKDYDYLYLEASEDGKTWTLLKTPSGTADDPTGANYGWGYTGTTNGWVEESIDLSQYAGKKVTLRFEYVTDAAVNGEGLLVDDMTIPAINYQTDFETDDGGWVSDGFARIENRLPQTFELTLIEFGSKTTVTPIEVGPDEKAAIPVDLENDVNAATLVVSGTTRFTRQPAVYNYEIVQ
jgi:immune inhibitor A